MHPILFSLRLTPETAQAMGLVTTFLLSIFILWDGAFSPAARANARAGAPSAGGAVSPPAWGWPGLRVGLVAQAGAFAAVGTALSLILLTPARLGEQVVIDIRAWGALGVATVVGTFLIQRHLGRALGVSSEQLLSIWVYAGSGGLIGARAAHVALNASWYAPNPLSALAFWDGGMVYLGGLVGCLLVSIVYLRRHRLPLRLFDALAVSVALTQGLGRIGCFLAGCCYGKETSLPFGVVFGPGSIALYTLQQTGEVAPDAWATPPLHPTQLYEAFASFALGAVLFALYRRRPAHRPGLILALYFASYSAMRFFIEIFRNDPERQFLFRYPEVSPLFLSTSQTAGLVLIAAAAIFAWFLRARGPGAGH